MRTQEIYKVIETATDYRLSKEDEKVFKSKYFKNPPKMKKVLYGVEIMKPISFCFNPSYKDDAGCSYTNSYGWVFEDMSGHWNDYVEIKCKKRAEQFKK